MAETLSVSESISFIANCGVGIGALLFVLSVVIEWAPIKFNPIGWIGDRFNRKTLAKIEEVEKKVVGVEQKLDTHIAESYRSKILKFQNECIDGKRHTQEEFVKIYSICDDYEEYVEANKLKNGEIKDAIAYIRRIYRKCLDEHDFVDLDKIS